MKNFWSAGTSRAVAFCLLATLGSVGTAAAQGGFYIGESNGKVEVTGGGTASTYATVGTDTIYGMVTDAANNLYFADESAGNVYKISPGGAQTTIATGLMSPGDVALDALGNVYVANTAAGTILKYPAAGGAGTTYASGLLMPQGMTFGPTGMLYVAEEGTSTSSNNGRITAIPVGGGTGTALATGLAEPVALTLNPAGTSVYVGFYQSGVVKGFTLATGAADNKYANLSVSGDIGDLTMDPQGNLYLASSSGDTILEASADGTTTSTYATLNGADYGFVYTAAVPEPSSWCALALGTAGLLAAGGLRRRRSV